jgi:ADP-heptose:LPS heptosyltransferase
MKIIKRKLSDLEFDSHHVYFAGPWVGEFGWEIARWQNGLRRLFLEHPDHYKIAMSSLGQHPLYDEADEFWILPEDLEKELEQNGVYRETARVWFFRAEGKVKRRVRQKQRDLNQLIEDELNEMDPNHVWKKPKWIKDPRHRKLTVKDDRWSREMEKPYFCVSYRHRTINSWGNWSKDRWWKLIDMVRDEFGIKNVAILGRPEEIDDLSGEPFEIDPELNLTRSIDLMCNCEFSITPESGSGFLSLLCEAPTVIFGHPKLKNRYLGRGNPLDTKAVWVGHEKRKFIPEDVIMGVEDVLS